MAFTLGDMGTEGGLFNRVRRDTAFSRSPRPAEALRINRMEASGGKAGGSCSKEPRRDTRAWGEGVAVEWVRGGGSGTTLRSETTERLCIAALHYGPR